MRRKWLIGIVTAIVISACVIQMALWRQAEINPLRIYGYKNARATLRKVVYTVYYAIGIKEEPGYLSEVTPFIRYFKEIVDLNGVRHIEEVESLPVGLNDRDFERLPLVNQGEDTFVLRRFTDAGSQQKFFYAPWVSENPLEFLRVLAANIKHGRLDDDLTFAEAWESLSHRHLSMTCGKASQFVERLLNWMGIKVRTGTSLTLEPWNAYNNGHTFLEVYFPVHGKWGIVDIDANRYFTLDGSVPASILDVLALGMDAIVIKRLSDDPFLDYSGRNSFQFLGEYVERNLLDWYLRVMQVFGIHDTKTGKYVFKADDMHVKARIESYSPAYEAIGHDEFMKRFYPQ